MTLRRALAAAVVACALALPGLARAGGGSAPHVLLEDFARGPAPASVVDALAADEARRDARPHVQPTAADKLRARRLLAEAARLGRRQVPLKAGRPPARCRCPWASPR